VSLWFLTDTYECGQREYQGELLISQLVTGSFDKSVKHGT
jgi:hypothetical protein